MSAGGGYQRNTHLMPSTWLTTAAFKRLRRVTLRRAQQQLAKWERKWAEYDAAPTEHLVPAVPRVRRVFGRRGRPALEVLADDVAVLYAVALEDVHDLAA